MKYFWIKKMNYTPLNLVIIILISFTLFGCSSSNGFLDKCDFNKDGAVDSIEKNKCGQELNNFTTTKKCGDGVCDDFEKINSDLCPLDCTPAYVDDGVFISAVITIDYSNELGVLNPYLFGSGNINSQGLNLAKDICFKLIHPAAPLPLYLSEDTDFSDFDKDITNIFNIGAEPFIVVPCPENKPVEMDKFVGSVKILAEHLKNQNQKHFWPDDKQVKLIRFGNEPDLAGGVFWKDSKQDFFDTYAVFAKTLKSVDPSLIIDSPGLAEGVDGQLLSGGISWTQDFLDYCNKNDIPLDYFSTHLYSPVPYTYYKNYGILQNKVNEYPNLSMIDGVAMLSNNEWLSELPELWSGIYGQQLDTAWLASHNVMALTNMIEQGVTLSATVSGISDGIECRDYLLDCMGNKKPGYYAFKSFNQLAGMTRISTEGHDHMNFAVIAGKKDSEIIVIVSNYDVKQYLTKYTARTVSQVINNTKIDIPNPAWSEYDSYVLEFDEPKKYNAFNLTFNNLPYEYNSFVYERYLVDDTHNLELVESKTMNGQNMISISADISAPSVQLIKIHLNS